MLKSKVLDKGFIEVVDSLGDDLTVVNSARVSFGKRKTKFDKSDERLVRYLAKYKHHLQDFRRNHKVQLILLVK